MTHNKTTVQETNKPPFELFRGIFLLQLQLYNISITLDVKNMTWSTGLSSPVLKLLVEHFMVDLMEDWTLEQMQIKSTFHFFLPEGYWPLSASSPSYQFL